MWSIPWDTLLSHYSRMAASSLPGEAASAIHLTVIKSVEIYLGTRQCPISEAWCWPVKSWPVLLCTISYVLIVLLEALTGPISGGGLFSGTYISCCLPLHLTSSLPGSWDRQQVLHSLPHQIHSCVVCMSLQGIQRCRNQTENSPAFKFL